MLRLGWYGLWVGGLVLAGCSPAVEHSHVRSTATSHVHEGDYPIRVLCTTGPVTELVTRVGGAHLAVEGLMGPGVDPHLYRPIASDVTKLNEADAIFYNGMHLEGRMADLFVQMARRKPTYAVTEGLIGRSDERLREPPEFEGLHDPHVWHDVSLWCECVKDVGEMLAELDPPNAAEYRANAASYVAELTEVDAYCAAEIAKIPAERRVLVTAHDAFGYFGKAYGLEVFGLKGISTEDEIDLEHQERIQKMLIERRVPAVFVETAIAPRTVQALVEPCRAAGHDLQVPSEELYADALGEAGSDEGTYAGMIRHNVRTIVSALTASQD